LERGVLGEVVFSGSFRLLKDGVSDEQREVDQSTKGGPTQVHTFIFIEFSMAKPNRSFWRTS
jgi:hypothetical protein